MSVADLHAHLQTGVTRVCQCWALARSDGLTLGFTDHDQALTFDGITFAADSGMSATALAASTGLSVNNTEAVGLLQSTAIRDEDIAAGRYDGAEVTMWQVCWDDVAARQIKFVGTIGEITRKSGTFQAELLGLTEALNQPQGRSYLRSCSAVLGDAACRIDLNSAAYRVEGTIVNVHADRRLEIDAAAFEAGWFESGKLEVLDGEAAGLTAAIKLDTNAGQVRDVTLWSPVALPLVIGQTVQLTTGCDRSARCCREKFSNLINFQGFPDIPGEDWLVSVPRSDQPNTGGSLNR